MEKIDISIVIRTKNEERWIKRCIDKIQNQKIAKNFEIIIVDSGSSDKTIEKVKEFDLKIIHIDEYKPGLSINKGVEKTKGNIIVLISAHAIPYDEYWLENLTKPFDEKGKIVATYGRQIPAEWSDPNDIRDLAITFGLEDRLQKKDTFFHNANSAFLKIFWEKNKFDEMATNIEDRIWAEIIIKNNFYIKYVANSIVYHWHGIHHYGNASRAKSTANVILNSTSIFKDLKQFSPEIKTITAIIPDYSNDDIKHKLFCIKNLLNQLSMTKNKWDLLFFTPYEPYQNSPDFPNLKCIWIKRESEELLNLNMVKLIKHCINFKEAKDNKILETVSVFNIYYLMRSTSDIEKAIKIYEKDDFDLLTTCYEENEREIHSIDGCLKKNNKEQEIYKFFLIKDNFSNILNGLNRNIKNDFLSIPGYLTLFHVSKIRDEEAITNLRVGYMKISGYEKMLKITNNKIVDKIRHIIF